MSHAIHVILAVDPAQVIGCAVTLRSIADNVRRDAEIRFHVLGNRLRPADRRSLGAPLDAGSRATVELHDVDCSVFDHLLRSKIVSRTTYARLLLQDLLPADVQRCIYIDCDVVVTRDIAEAWEHPLEGRTLAAVANGDARDTAGHQQRLGLAEPRYLNAGFLVIDVERWRARDVGPRAIRVAAALGDALVLHDQDALNITVQGDWSELPAHWNASVPFSPMLTADSKAAFHYMGAPKPWEVDYDGRFPEVFQEYLARTPFAQHRAWNPMGVGRMLARLRRRIPYPPTVLRLLRSAVLGRTSLKRSAETPGERERRQPDADLHRDQ